MKKPSVTPNTPLSYDPESGKLFWTGVAGVRWHKTMKKWIANIAINEEIIHLGYFDDVEEAVKVRKEAENLYWSKK